MRDWLIELESEKFHNPLSTSWGHRKAGDIVPVQPKA